MAPAHLWREALNANAWHTNAKAVVNVNADHALSDATDFMISLTIADDVLCVEVNTATLTAHQGESK